MQLNEVERKALEKARRLETRWPRSRLMGLFVGVVMVASGLVPDHFQSANARVIGNRANPVYRKALARKAGTSAAPEARRRKCRRERINDFPLQRNLYQVLHQALRPLFRSSTTVK
jgi:hypothetical protein